MRAKILDFGLALPTQVDTRLTQTGAIVGTPAYMSPEQIKGADLDERSDIYSLACVIWEALAGRYMVDGREIGEIVLNVIHTPPPPISSFVAGLTPEIDNLFAAALAKSRQGRPSDVEAWASSLATLLETQEFQVERGWPSLELQSRAVAANFDTQTPTIG